MSSVDARRSLVLVVGALVAFGVGRSLPASGLGLWLRLSSATALIFVPGAFCAVALGLPLSSCALTVTLAFIGVGLAITFAVQGSLGLAMLLAAAAAALGVVVCLRLARPRPMRPRRRGSASALVLVVGLLLGAAAWPLAPALSGDALFHLARVRKLLSFGSLTLHRLDEFRDGGLHPGYAFPLWHGLLAFVARAAAVDPALVLRRESTVLVVLAVAVAYEAGCAVFQSASGGWAVMIVQLGLFVFAPGHGGALPSLSLPATAARELLVPAVLVLFFHRYSADGRWRYLPYLFVAAATSELALVHVTYALFTGIVLVGFLCVRALFRLRAQVEAGARIAAALVGIGAVLIWLEPIVATTRSHNPACAEVRRAFANYRGQLIHSSCHHYRLAPTMVTRSGAIAVASLLLVPVAAFAIRRAWAALVIGGTVAILLLLLTSWTFPWFADIVSISQARRAAGFVPIPFALVGGIAIVTDAPVFATRRAAALAAALLAGIALEFAYPGWFGAKAPLGAPAYPAWVAFFGGAAGLILARLIRRPIADPSVGGFLLTAVLLFVLPVAINGVSEWTPLASTAPFPLSRGLRVALDRPELRGTTVFSDPDTSYEVAAYAPVYVASAPPSHVANTRANDPYRRWDDAMRFLHSGALAIPRSYHACTILLRQPSRIHPLLPLIYRDRRFLLYRLEPACR